MLHVYKNTLRARKKIKREEIMKNGSQNNSITKNKKGCPEMKL